MYATTVLSALLLAGSSFAQTDVATSTQAFFNINSNAVTAATGNAPTPSGSPENTRTLTVYDMFSLAATVTPVCSVIAAGSADITYKLDCPFRGSTSACGNLNSPVTLTQGSANVQFTSVASGQSAAFTVSCDVKKDITCIAQNPASTSTYTLTGTQVWPKVEATITAGAFKLVNSTNPLFNPSGSGAVLGTAASTGLATSTTAQTTSSSASASPAPSSSRGAAVANMPAVAGSLAGMLLAILAL